MKKHFEFLENILENPTPLKLKLLDRILRFVIPFNAPLGLKFIAIDKNSLKVQLPYKRSNFNHLKGIHACAIATLGEFCAGMSLIQKLKFSKYRLIMSHLEANYSYQGKSDIVGETKILDEELNQVLEKLHTGAPAYIKICTTVTDQHNNLVAEIFSTWQLKEWKRVKTKI